ncbi:hypothetical protein ACFC58_39735 [Kitasatospora purpeofusca]|uniref:hypothetical protein n=1 Tax=Kitasatospora purpeofusca TaxID=67352 RepID=UPI0035DD493F
MNALLPDGWTIEQVRCAADDARADLLSLDRLVVVERHGCTDYGVLQPDVVIAFHSYNMCLARVGEDWFMGHLEPDGSVVCWASYGTDLGEVIRGL